MMMKSILTSLFVCCALSLVCAPVLAQSKGPNPEASQEVRDKAAVAKLKANSGTVAVYAQGLCCPSCAIGVRKKVSGLPFVDQGRLEKGILLDAKTQLVTIALRPGSKVDTKALSQAIVDAGYEPVHLYRLDGDKLVTTKISAE
jgi:copper chaperone CopZ